MSFSIEVERKIQSLAERTFNSAVDEGIVNKGEKSIFDFYEIFVMAFEPQTKPQTKPDEVKSTSELPPIPPPPRKVLPTEVDPRYPNLKPKAFLSPLEQVTKKKYMDPKTGHTFSSSSTKIVVTDEDRRLYEAYRSSPNHGLTELPELGEFIYLEDGRIARIEGWRTVEKNHVIVRTIRHDGKENYPQTYSPDDIIFFYNRGKNT